MTKKSKTRYRELPLALNLKAEIKKLRSANELSHTVDLSVLTLTERIIRTYVVKTLLIKIVTHNSEAVEEKESKLFIDVLKRQMLQHIAEYMTAYCKDLVKRKSTLKSIPLSKVLQAYNTSATILNAIQTTRPNL